MFANIMSLIPAEIRAFLKQVFLEESVAPVTKFFKDMLIAMDVALPYLILIGCLVLGFFGKRLFPYIRTGAFLAVGFFVGVMFCGPFIQQHVPAIPQLAVGIAVGVLVAVLSRFLYNVVYIGVVVTAVGFVCYNGWLIPVIEMVAGEGVPMIAELEALLVGNLTVSLIVAAVIALITLIFRKPIEMIGTAMVGALGFAFFFTFIFEYTVYFPIGAVWTICIFAAILALPMMIYQYRTRVRY